MIQGKSMNRKQKVWHFQHKCIMSDSSLINRSSSTISFLWSSVNKWAHLRFRWCFEAVGSWRSCPASCGKSFHISSWGCIFSSCLPDPPHPQLHLSGQRGRTCHQMGEYFPKQEEAWSQFTLPFYFILFLSSMKSRNKHHVVLVLQLIIQFPL